MIRATDLTYRYNADNIIKLPNFDYQQGEQVLVLGASGCGKTTLLHLLSGLLSPTSGSVQIQDANLSNMKGSALDSFRGSNIGIIFQTPHFIAALSVKENLIMAQTLSGNKKDVSRIETLLAELGISQKINASVKDLSQGEKQRVTIARALINSPKIILADEPTSALDDNNCKAVINLLKNQAAKNNATLLIVTHDNRLLNEFDKKLLL